MSGFSVADVTVSAESAKPTETIALQLSDTRLCRLPGKSAAESDCTSANPAPSSSAAFLVPS